MSQFEKVADLPLFALPDIRTPAPSARGSKSSEDAADMITKGPFRRASWRKIMLALAAASGPTSRETLSQRIGIPQHVLCARLSELRPIWVEAVDRVCVSSAGVQVDGYQLTDLGRARVRSAQEPLR